MERCCWPDFDFADLVAKGLGVSAAATTIWEDFESDSFSGESFRIFRGRNGILDGGEEVCGGALLSSVADGVALGISLAADESWRGGCMRAWA